MAANMPRTGSEMSTLELAELLPQLGELTPGVAERWIAAAMAHAAALHEHGAKSDLIESRAAFAEKRKPNFKGWDNPADRYRLPKVDAAEG